MSAYPNFMSDPTITQWGDYDIAVRTGTNTWGELIGEISASYEVSKAGNLLLSSSVSGGYATAEIAAQNAIRIAKLDAREQLNGPFPNE